MKALASHVSGAAMVLMASACASGPSYEQPVAPVASNAAFVSADPTLFASEPPPGEWWRLYNDPLLDQLITDAFSANTDLRVAAGNLRRARALLSEARSARLPSTTLRAQSTDASSRPEAAALAADAEPNAYEAWADISYEFDLFGRIEHGVQANRADAQAQQAAYDLVRITVAADVAHAYSDVCAIGAQVRAAERAASAQTESARVAERRLQLGEASGLEAAQAQAELARTRAELPSLVAERRVALYRLAVLTGRQPADYPRALEACFAPPQFTNLIPIGDAGALLRRRPDIRQAERKLAASSARVGVAISDLYPRLTLGFSGGVTAEQNGDAVTRLQLTPLISWTFPNIAGARARIAQARAGSDVALAEWDGAVLKALRETESALAQYAGELDRSRALTIMRDQSAVAAQRARLRRDAGADSPLTQLDAERRLAEAESLLAASQRQLASNRITLFLALGGGWETNPAGRQ